MKKIIFGTFLVAIMGVFLALNVNLNAGDTEGSLLTMSNIEALAQGEGDIPGGGSSVTCYSTYSNCWFWGCSTIYRCGVCSTESADSYSNSGSCTP